MAFTGTEKSLAKISNLKANNLLLSDNSIPVNVNFDINDSLASYFQLLVDKINELEQKVTEVHPTVETGFIQVFAGNAIDEETAAILPPPLGYDWCFGQIVSKTDEKYANLYSVIGNYWNTSNTLTDDQFQLPDLRNVFLRGCPEYIKSSEENRLVGNFQACGVPNSKGVLNHSIVDIQGNGPFYYISEKHEYAGYTQYTFEWRAGFDLSRSSPVYQDGLTEVRPDNKAVNYIIKL